MQFSTQENTLLTASNPSEKSGDKQNTQSSFKQSKELICEWTLSAPLDSLGLGWERLLVLARPNQQPHTCRLGPGVCSPTTSSLLPLQPPQDFTLATSLSFELLSKAGVFTLLQ